MSRNKWQQFVCRRKESRSQMFNCSLKSRETLSNPTVMKSFEKNQKFFLSDQKILTGGVHVAQNPDLQRQWLRFGIHQMNFSQIVKWTNPATDTWGRKCGATWRRWLLPRTPARARLSRSLPHPPALIRQPHKYHPRPITFHIPCWCLSPRKSKPSKWMADYYRCRQAWLQMTRLHFGETE